MRRQINGFFVKEEGKSLFNNIIVIKVVHNGIFLVYEIKDSRTQRVYFFSSMISVVKSILILNMSFVFVTFHEEGVFRLQ